MSFRLLPGAQLQPVTPADKENTDSWHVVGNIQGCCPYCNAKQGKSHNTDKDIEDDANGNMEDNRLQKLRLSADFISRMMAPSVLDQLDKENRQQGVLYCTTDSNISVLWIVVRPQQKLH